MRSSSSLRAATSPRAAGFAPSSGFAATATTKPLVEQKSMTHVLAPRPAGTLAAIGACPDDADVVLVAHTGLDEIFTVPPKIRIRFGLRCPCVRSGQVRKADLPTIARSLFAASMALFVTFSIQPATTLL